MTGFNLSNVRFTAYSDIVNQNSTIYNPLYSYVNTGLGDDQIIGNHSLTGDFALGAFVGIAAQNTGAISTLNLSQQASVFVDGIINQGTIDTSYGNDIIRGTATANISVNVQTVAQVIAYANKADTAAISRIFASLNVNATSNGIDNSKGKIYTGPGNDTVTGNNLASISAVAVASVDAKAIVEAVLQAPLSNGLTAFASAMATSIANAKVTATSIKNIQGIINTGDNNDTLTASATSSAATLSVASVASFSTASPGNQALAQAVANATAQTFDQAIGINNTSGGCIDTGSGHDSLQVTAKADDKAIAILNTGGNIYTGSGDDKITAQATGAESWGIFGGTIDTGSGNDQIIASSFGGGVKIFTGDGNDYVQGFGNARIDGGWGYDILSLGSYNKTDFNISFGYDGFTPTVTFQRDGMSLTASGFQQINFANNTSCWNMFPFSYI